MKTFLAVLAVAAVAAANVVPRDQCPLQGNLLQRLAAQQLENINLKTAAGEPVTGLPLSTDECDWTSGLSCAGDIGSAVLDCPSLLMNVTGPLDCPVLEILGQLCWTVLVSLSTLWRLFSVFRMLLELAMIAGLVSAGLLSGSWGMDTVIR